MKTKETAFQGLHLVTHNGVHVLQAHNTQVRKRPYSTLPSRSLHQEQPHDYLKGEPSLTFSHGDTLEDSILLSVNAVTKLTKP